MPAADVGGRPEPGSGGYAGEGEDIVERELAFRGDHLLQFLFLLRLDVRGMKNIFDQLRRHKARVVPLTVVADPEIKHINIFIAITRIDVKEEEGVKDDEQDNQQPDGTNQRFGLQHHHQRSKPRRIHGDKQTRMFANKADAEARLVVTLFANIEIINGFGKQALYLGHLLPFLNSTQYEGSVYFK